MDTPTALPTVSIHDAAKNGDLKSVQAWLNHNIDLINSRDVYGRTPLHFAAFNKHLEIMDLLLQKGADFRLKNKRGVTALYSAVRKARTSECAKAVELLLQYGDDANQSFEKNQLIHIALHNEYTEAIGADEILSVLLRYQADPNALNNDRQDGITSLMDIIKDTVFLHLAKEEKEYFIKRDYKPTLKPSNELSNV